MVTKQQIAKAKLFPMAALLEYLGYMPAEQRGNELIYFSPFRTEEKTPSFCVNIKGNVCNDFGDREKSGDVIRLYTNLKGCNFLTAVHDLCNNKINTAQSSSFIHYEPIITKEKQQAEIVEIKDRISNKSLIHYLESRCINPETANLYCKEIHYKQPNGKIYHSIGFKNDSDGWELRSANFKSCVGKKDITIIVNKGIKGCLLFEGFFNFLSFWMLKPNFNATDYDFIILNSTSLLKRAITILDKSNYPILLTYFDNDNSGIKAEIEIEQAFPFHDITHVRKVIHYTTDLNDFLIEKLSK